MKMTGALLIALWIVIPLALIGVFLYLVLIWELIFKDKDKRGV
jgi:hypothetical protein